MKKAIVIILASIIYLVIAFCVARVVENVFLQACIVGLLAGTLVFFVVKFIKKKQK